MGLIDMRQILNSAVLDKPNLISCRVLGYGVIVVLQMVASVSERCIAFIFSE
jgi:hypothetical protein